MTMELARNPARATGPSRYGQRQVVKARLLKWREACLPAAGVGCIRQGFRTLGLFVVVSQPASMLLNYKNK
jgi:hypothetical protein